MFVWHDLMTENGDQAVEFYRSLFDWTTEVVDLDEAGPYTMFRKGGKEAAGMVAMELPPGLHPHWMSYIAVNDLEASLAELKELGGALQFGPLPAGDVGTFAVVADPQGAVFSLFQFNESPSHEDMPQGPGSFAWDNLFTDDVPGALEFYCGLFGWTTEPVDLGDLGEINILRHDAQYVGGVLKKPEEVKTGPYWQSYVLVEDVDESHAKAIELGGAEYYPPTEIEGMGEFSVLGDPAGAMFCLIEWEDQNDDDEDNDDDYGDDEEDDDHSEHSH
jgi:predicted enzyme related to lactoylglutathione lyase